MRSTAESDVIGEDVDGEIELQNKFFRKCLLEEETERVRVRKYLRRRVNGSGVDEETIASAWRVHNNIVSYESHSDYYKSGDFNIL